MSETATEEIEAGEAGALEPDAAPEPEQGDDDLEPEDAAAEPVPDDQGWSETEREKRYGKINTSFNTYKAAVERNLEEEALDLLPCPLCFVTPHPSFVNKHGIGNVPPEVEENVKTFLGYAREREYQQAQGVTGCGECGGRGKVKTGSLVSEHATITCPNCHGCGYMPPPNYLRQGGGNGGGAQPVIMPPADDLPQPERDNWGEPKVLPDGTLNDNYGKQPQFKTVHPKYGITAQLGAAELVTEQG